MKLQKITLFLLPSDKQLKSSKRENMTDCTKRKYLTTKKFARKVSQTFNSSKSHTLHFDDYY